MPDNSIAYIPHGGGPLPLLGDIAHEELVEGLRELARTMPRPSTILVVSAHWEAEVPTITSAAQPGLLFDYYGFPPESYEIEYQAPGNPVLAERVRDLLEAAGLRARLDDRRGLDHGVFVPLRIMYPDASIPCVQLSLEAGLDPESHLRIGQSLAGLRGEGVLVLGSGFSFHNLRELMRRDDNTHDRKNEAFQSWLVETCTSAGRSGLEREKLLAGWESAPFARYCHPREEHLIPLLVCQAMAGSRGRVIFDGPVMGKRAVGFSW